METVVELIAALLPAIVLLVYIWKKDPHKEPVSQLVRAVLLGVAICLPVATAEMYIQRAIFGADGTVSTLFDSTIQAFCVAAIPEESAKLFVLWLLLRKNPHFDEHFDGIIYAVYVSLGFAAVENVFYVMSQENWWSVAVARALLAVPGHYAFAVMMGYYYALYHFVERSKKNAVCMLLVPVMAHGIYDALALSGSVNPLVGGIAFVVLVFFCIKMHKFARNKIQQLL